MASDEQNAPPKVEVYTTMLCPYCFMAKKLLKKKDVDFEEISVDMAPDKRARMRERAEGRNTVPQIFIGGEGIGGCDELIALDESGELDRLLGRTQSA